MMKRLFLAALASSVMMTGSAQADVVFSQDFSGPLGVNERVEAGFQVGGGFVGHQGGRYQNNESSFYQLRLDLRNVTDAVMSFDYDIFSEFRYDGFNVGFEQDGVFSPVNVLSPTSGMYHGALLGQAASVIGPSGFSGVQVGRGVFDLSAFDGQVVNLRFRFASDNAGWERGVRLDNLLVTGASISAVPEPAIWAMMIVGFGMAGGAIRNRRRIVTEATA